jgi:hypothetical protein
MPEILESEAGSAGLQLFIEESLDRVIVREQCPLGYDRNVAALSPNVLAEGYRVSVSASRGRFFAASPRLSIESLGSLAKFGTNKSNEQVRVGAKHFGTWSGGIVSNPVDAEVLRHKGRGCYGNNARPAFRLTRGAATGS